MNKEKPFNMDRGKHEMESYGDQEQPKHEVLTSDTQESLTEPEVEDLLEKNGVGQEKLEALLSDDERERLHELSGGDVKLNQETQGILEKIGNKIESAWNAFMNRTTRDQRIMLASTPASVIGGVFGGLLFSAPGFAGGLAVGQAGGQAFFRGIVRLDEMIKRDTLKNEGE